MNKSRVLKACAALVLALAGCAGTSENRSQTAMFEEDSITTSAGPLKITFVGHGTLMFTCGDTVVHVDPWSRKADYTKMPKADVILVTHGHSDHLDPEAVMKIQAQTCAEVLAPADVLDILTEEGADTSLFLPAEGISTTLLSFIS